MKAEEMVMKRRNGLHASTGSFRSRRTVCAVLAGVIGLCLQHASTWADEPAAIVTDTKGARITLSRVTTTEFRIQVGDSATVVPLEKIVRINSVVPGKTWKVSQTTGASVEGSISGDLAGEWALGKYSIEMARIQTVLFPGRQVSSTDGGAKLARAIDSKGASIDLTAIETKSFSLAVGPATATIQMDRVAEIAKVDGKEGLWRVTLLDAPPLEGTISGDLVGEWALGKYTAKLDNLARVTFADRVGGTSWPDKPVSSYAASCVLDGGVELRATGVAAVPRNVQYDYGEEGGAQHIEKSTLVVMNCGGADLLFDVRKVKHITRNDKGGAATVELLDGKTYEGALSENYTLSVDTSWGRATFPHSAIHQAQITPARIAVGVDAKGEEAIAKLFAKAVFPGMLLLRSGQEIPVDAFVLEYSNSYSYYSTAGYLIGGRTVSGHPHFAAIEGIPCKIGDSVTELAPDRIAKMAMNTSGPVPGVQISAIGGGIVDALLADDKNPEGLKKYHTSTGSNYSLLDVLGRCSFGYVRVPIDRLMEIRRRGDE